MSKKLYDKKVQRKIWIVLAIVILPAFILWGSGSIIRRERNTRYPGVISGKKISWQEYEDALSSIRNLGIIQFGENFSKIEKYMNFPAQALERILLLTEAKKRKISASDQEVVNTIQNYPFFKEKGLFDQKIYEYMLQYEFRIAARAFEEQIRKNIILGKLFLEITKDVYPKDDQIRGEYQKDNEQLSIDYIASVALDFSKNLDPTEEELKNYFTKNSLIFKEPPSFNIEYLTLESEVTTKEAYRRLRKGENFLKVAGDLKAQVKETGWLNQNDPNKSIEWSPQLLEIMSKLKVGQFSLPVLSDKKYNIFRLKGIREAYIPELKKIKEKVKEGFLKEKSLNMAKEKILECLKDLQEKYKLNIKSADFEKAAKEHGLKSGSTGLFKDNSYVEGIGASDDFFRTVRNLKTGEFSQIIQGAGGFYIVKLKTLVEIDENKFLSEKKEFTEELLVKQKQEYFSKFVEDLKTKAQIF